MPCNAMALKLSPFTNISRTEQPHRQGMPRNRAELMAGIVYLAAADIGRVARGYPAWRVGRVERWIQMLVLRAVGICGLAA
jgi:hypothetical protein